MDVESIRAAYPNPRQGWASQSSLNGLAAVGTYCVGGAFVLALGVKLSSGAFPTRAGLAQYLQVANDALKWKDAFDIAVHLVDANDAGNFEDAWAWLAKGLEAR